MGISKKRVRLDRIIILKEWVWDPSSSIYLPFLSSFFGIAFPFPFPFSPFSPTPIPLLASSLFLLPPNDNRLLNHPHLPPSKSLIPRPLLHDQLPPRFLHRLGRHKTFPRPRHSRKNIHPRKRLSIHASLANSQRKPSEAIRRRL